MGICSCDLNHYLFNHIQKHPRQKSQDCGTLQQDPEMDHLALNMLWAWENMERILHRSALGSLRRLSEDSWMNVMNSQPQENDEEKQPTTHTYSAQRNTKVLTAYKNHINSNRNCFGLGKVQKRLPQMLSISFKFRS